LSLGILNFSASIRVSEIHRWNPNKMQFFGGSDISPSPPAPTASGNNAHMMYVFNRNGVCLLYREWNRPLHTLNAQQDHKLMFGLLFSLKSLTAKMDPTRFFFLISLMLCNFSCCFVTGIAEFWLKVQILGT